MTLSATLPANKTSPVNDDWFDEILTDLDKPTCPRPGCHSPAFEHDTEYRAWICDDCGLWQDDEDDSLL